MVPICSEFCRSSSKTISKIYLLVFIKLYDEKHQRSTGDLHQLITLQMYIIFYLLMCIVHTHIPIISNYKKCTCNWIKECYNWLGTELWGMQEPQGQRKWRLSEWNCAVKWSQKYDVMHVAFIVIIGKVRLIYTKTVSCEKRVQPQNARVKKDLKLKVAARKWLW